MIGLMMGISGLIKEEMAILGRRKYCGGNITALVPCLQKEFQRTSFKLVDNHSIVLVHYTGDGNVYVPRPHGNKKSDPGDDFVSTCPSVLSQIKEKVVHASDKPQEVYRSMVPDGNKVSGKYQGVLCRRK